MKEDKIKEKITEANDNWNYCKFKLYWNNLEWVYPQKINTKKNPLCYSTHKFYIKNVNQTCNFSVRSKLKPCRVIQDSGEKFCTLKKNSFQYCCLEK